MMKEGVSMETTETYFTPCRGEQISTAPPLPQGKGIIPYPLPRDDSGTVKEPQEANGPGTESQGESVRGLKPNFRVGEICEGKENRVLLSSVSIVDGNVTVNDNLALNIHNFSETHQNPHPENGDATILSISPAESAEDTQLSLVSWYSEPGDTGTLIPIQSCCMKKRSVKTSSSGHLEVIGDKSDKENKTPTPDASIPLSATGSSGKSKPLLHLRMRSHNPDKRNSKRLDSQRCKSAANSADINETTTTLTSDHENLECPRCSRKSKSGTVTPAIPSRSPKRQLAPKKLVPDLKKPIKSILKHEFRTSSSGSGSEKRSSMDSVESNGKSSNNSNSNQMTRSDLGQRLRAKLKFDELNGTPWSEGDFTGLKRIERYATLRIRKRRVTPPIENHYTPSGTDSSSDLMTKSLCYIKTQEHPEMVAAPLQRHGSLRGRKASPTVQPCATRTSALRLLKIQEKNAKLQQNSHEKSNAAESPEFNSNSHQSSQPSKQQPFPRNTVSKVFSKLSSAFGQTASSSQKRLKQERGVQTEPILILRTESRGGRGSSSANGSSRSPTPLSPLPDEQWEGLAPADEIIRLRLELSKYKARVAKYQLFYNEAEHENVLMGNHLRELERESKEMINFLQDEKSMLTETLAEAEVEILVWSEKFEAQSKLVLKLEEKLSREKYRSQMKEAKQSVEKQTSDLETESTKTKKLQTEIEILKKRVESLNME